MSIAVSVEHRIQRVAVELLEHRPGRTLCRASPDWGAEEAVTQSPWEQSRNHRAETGGNRGGPTQRAGRIKYIDISALSAEPPETFHLAWRRPDVRS
jgi:hypothetical protein